MTRKTRDEWAKVEREWSRSGQTGAEFAAEIGVKEATLRHWKWRLDHGVPSRRRRRSESAFVRVAPIEVPLVGAEAESIEVVLLGGVRIRVPAEFEGATLRRVLDILELR
jgi:hypothetical protein